MRLAPAAPYSRETLDRIRRRTRECALEEVIAAELGWGLPWLRRIAKRHEIELLTEEKLKKRFEAAEAEEKPIPTTPSPRKVEFDKAAPSFSRAGGQKGVAHPRAKQVQVSLSVAGVAGLRKASEAVPIKASTAIGIVADYLARSGKLPALLKEALAEIGHE